MGWLGGTATSGFAGLWVDRRGAAGDCAALEAASRANGERGEWGGG